MRKVIAISGTGRSGTNILKSIFSKHSKIATLPFEYRFVIDPKGIVDFYDSYTGSWSPYKADFKIKELEEYLLSLAQLNDEKMAETANIKSIDPKGLKLTPPPYSGWELNQWIPGYADFVHELIKELTRFKYSAVWPGAEARQTDYQMTFGKRMSKEHLAIILESFLAKCLGAICEHQKREIYLEDNTHNILFASELNQIMPGMKLIHMVRDPRDVISSLMIQKWAPRNLEQCIEWYKEVMYSWWVQREKLDSNVFTEIQFETLLNSHKKTLTSICTFSKIEFEESLLKTKLDKPNIGRHKSSFSLDEIRLIETETKQIGNYYNYF
jgi:hypothetical protein